MKHPLPGSMRRVRDRLSAVAAVGLILLPVIAQAAEGEAGHAAEHHAPSPWGLIYPFINFAIYSFVLWRYAWPAVRDYLSDRRANTLSALEAAKSVRAEAEALKAEYDAKLRNLEGEAARAREEVLATSWSRHRSPPIGFARIPASSPTRRSRARVAPFRKRVPRLSHASPGNSSPSRSARTTRRAS